MLCCNKFSSGFVFFLLLLSLIHVLAIVVQMEISINMPGKIKIIPLRVKISDTIVNVKKKFFTRKGSQYTNNV